MKFIIVDNITANILHVCNTKYDAQKFKKLYSDVSIEKVEDYELHEEITGS